MFRNDGARPIRLDPGKSQHQTGPMPPASILDRFDLKAKIILLTGGAGLYGRGLTADLASANATLIIASRNRDAGEAVAEEERALGRNVTAVSLDQGSEDSVIALRDFVVEKFGRLDGLVNNAVARPMVRPDDPASAWEDSLKVNGTGVFLMHRHLGGIMARQKSGSIVNIGSIQGMVGPARNLYEGTGLNFGAPDYFFHKGGLINLTRYYASLFGPDNVRVNCLAPGGFFNDQPDAFVRAYSQQTFLNRMGNPTDLGGSVVFLLSDASLYVTGANLPVDGGYTAR